MGPQTGKSKKNMGPPKGHELETTMELLFESLMHSVNLFLDWKSLGEIVGELGAELD
jgi:hypothetical protein